MTNTAIFKLSALADRKPEYALVGEVDLVVVRFDDEVSVFYGRCLHRGALMADGHVRGKDLICGVHNWDYRLDTGVSAYANDEKLPKFKSWIEGDDICVDADEINAWGRPTRNRLTANRIWVCMPTPPTTSPKNRTPVSFANTHAAG